MKVFIVFLGLCIINVSFLSYQGDMGRYVRCQNYMKAAAEECAAGAALYYNENRYADGVFQFDYDEGERYIRYFLKHAEDASPFPEGTKIQCTTSFSDDVIGYDPESDPGKGVTTTIIKDGVPSVTVSLKAETQDLFHLPFLCVTEVKRMAKYELPQ